MSKALDRLNKELDKLVKDPSNVKDYSRFEKDKTQKIGIISSVLRKFSSEQFKQVKSLDKKEILLLCEKLLKSKKIGKKAIAFGGDTFARQRRFSTKRIWLDTKRIFKCFYKRSL